MASPKEMQKPNKKMFHQQTCSGTIRFQYGFEYFSDGFEQALFRGIVISHYNTARVWKFDG